MLHQITVLPQKQNIAVQPGENLLNALRRAGFFADAVCGGTGSCGKCKVLIDGTEALACRTTVDRDMVITMPENGGSVILTDGIRLPLPADSGVCLAIDIGTTTVAAYLLKNGKILATESRKNPQSAFGADVVTRIRYAVNDKENTLTQVIRSCLQEITDTLLRRTGISRLDTVAIVGNCAMLQLFLGASLENLKSPPYPAVFTEAQTLPGPQFFPAWEGAAVRFLPAISGFVGADTVACILATNMDCEEKLTLLVDIGTNGEMVLGSKDGMVACATAAGPALEGAGIAFGMQAQPGAIDRVNADLSCHVIGDGKALGICGSGLLDAAAAALDTEQINSRGRILNSERRLNLTDSISLTQEDIRQLQQAKGAIAAGIQVMARHLGISVTDIEKVYLAGAFGTFLNPRSACRMGLLPGELEDKIEAVGNAAGSGAMLIACDRQAFENVNVRISKVTHLNLAAAPDWAKAFAKSMFFDTAEEYWRKKALSMGFAEAAVLDTGKLTVREDVRAMCASDKCGAYGKNHTCPPHCGTLQACAQKLHGFSRGILVQTVGKTEKLIDTKAYRRIEQQHLTRFYALAEEIRKYHPGALCLGSGGCRICPSCSWPEPCRFPEKVCSSMEAYGLFVTDVCKENGLLYHHGERTVTYNACILF